MHFFSGRGSADPDPRLPTVIGRVRRPAIDAQRRVVVRLQAVDAPELHYRSPCLVSASERTAKQTTAFHAVSHDYRQPFGETATLALRASVS